MRLENLEVQQDAAFLAAGEVNVSMMPTSEKNMAAAAEELARSNAMRLECAELISESSLQLALEASASSSGLVKWNATARDYVDHIQQFITSLPAATLDCSSSLLPLTSDRLLSDSTKFEVFFGGGKMLKCKVVGTAANGLMLRRTANAFVAPTIDLAVLIPPPTNSKESFFLPKDYLNYRYMDKRNLLAHHIAKLLSKKRKRFGTAELSYYNGDTRRLVVLLSPPTNDSKPLFRVRLLLGTDGLAFPRSVYLPNRNNIRYSKMVNQRSGVNKSNNTAQDQHQQPTPHYNNALAEDAMHQSIACEIQETSRKATYFHDASVLIQVWAAQRGMLYGHDSVGSIGFILLLTYLYRTKKITPRQTPWHAFVAMLKFLSETDFVGDDFGGDSINNDSVANSIGYQGLKLNYGKAKSKRHAIFMPQSTSTKNDNNLDDDSWDVEEDCIPLHKQHGCDAIFLDSTGILNFFAHCSASSMREVRWEAKTSLQIIRDPKHFGGSAVIGNPDSAFRRLFFVNCRFWRKHDLYVRVPLTSLGAHCTFATTAHMHHGRQQPQALEENWKMKCLDLGNYEAASRTAVELVTAALGDRTTLVRPLNCGNGEHVDGVSVRLGTLTNIGVNVPSSVNNVLYDTDQAIAWPPIGGSTKKEEEGSSNCLQQRLACPLNWQGNVPSLIIGLRVNGDTSARVVDRGPPADEKDSVQSKEFKAFWGNKAELRRFKDGAIVHAVVWNTNNDNDYDENKLIAGGETNEGLGFSYCSPEISNGIVERIVRYILCTHMLRSYDSCIDTRIAASERIMFLNTGILGLVESVHCKSSTEKVSSHTWPEVNSSSVELHRDVLKVYNDLSNFLVERTKDETNRLGGIPMSIDSVEAISPSLRYSELFPPIKHPLFYRSGDALGKAKKVPGVMSCALDPICIQIRLGRSNKWPSDLNAMGAAKCALLLQLAEGIERERPKTACLVTPTYIDVTFEGYSFRLYVRPDEELKLIDSLKNPTTAALERKYYLEKQQIIAASHHSTMHAVHTRYPCASATVRLARKWVASHLLSGMFPMEAIELIVAKAFTDPAPLATPGSVATGFLRFLFLLSSHDFAKQPFIVDPQGHLTRSDYENIFAHFENCRGDDYTRGPPMYIITPNDRKEMKKSNEKHDGGAFFPTFTITHPEQVILSRAAALAKRSFSYLLSCISSGLEPEVGAVFQESTQSLRSFSALFRVDPAILVDSACSSTDGDFAMSTNQNGQIETPFMKSYRRRINGPKALRKTTYKNLTTSAGEGLLQEWQPVNHLVQSLRSKFGDKAVFFFNELSPDIIALLWRPDTFKSGPLSALHSENKRPIENIWHSDSLVVTNQDDIMTEIEHMCQPVVLEVKVLDDQLMRINSGRSLKRQKLPRRYSEEFISDNSD